LQKQLQKFEHSDLQQELSNLNFQIFSIDPQNLCLQKVQEQTLKEIKLFEL
jgi:hypothetical protein